VFFLFNLEKKKINKPEEEEDIISKLSSFSRLGSYLCSRSEFLNCKIINFFLILFLLRLKILNFQNLKYYRDSIFYIYIKFYLFFYNFVILLLNL